MSSRIVPLLLASAMTAGALPEGALAAPPRRGPPPPQPSGPVEESLAERRAVRGASVDDVGSSESPELREIRRFEELAFPRTAGGSAPPSADSPLPPSLPGTWGGSGDVPPELRSPTPATRAEAAPPPDSDWLRGLSLPDLPVRWDPQVLRYLDYFKSEPRGRAVMNAWLRRAGRYRDLIDRALVRQGLPKDLIAVAMVESGFDTGARSRVGAGGIWQFMPGAGRAYGLEVSYWVDARRDPERSAEAAARYLKDLHVRFGSWPLVFAAYNAGYGAVLRSITSYNTNDYWELIRHEAGLPWESSIYVPKILAAAIVCRNAAAFGFTDVTPDPPFVYEEVEVAPGTALATIARAAGAKVEVVESLNPHLVRGRTPPDRGPSRVRIPPGTAALYAASIEKTRAANDKVDVIVLRFGETLDEIARARGMSTRELRRLNGVKDSVELRAGTSIVVPRRAPAAGDDPTDKAASGGPDDDFVIVAVPERAFSYEGRERVFYRTRDGDGLDEVADVFGVRTDELIEWNNLDPGAKLHPKMVLQIFVRKDFDPAGCVLLDPAKVRVVTLGSEEFHELETARRGKKRLYYTAKSGDTLAKIGRRYGLSPGDLARINRFSYNTELKEGDRIVVYSPTGEMPREVTMGLTPSKKRPERGAGRDEAPAKAKAGSGGRAVAATAKASEKTGDKTGGKAAGKTAVKSADGGGAARSAKNDKAGGKKK